MKIECPQCHTVKIGLNEICDVCGYKAVGTDFPVSAEPEINPQKIEARKIFIFFVVALTLLVCLSGIAAYKNNIKKAELAAIEKQNAEIKEKVDREKRRLEIERERANRAIEKVKEDELCKNDIQCWGDKNSSSAIIASRDSIERYAKYQFKWTDGFLEPKLSRCRWKDKSRLIVTYLGDKIMFQNGFGAWQNMIYQIDYDPINEKVLNIKVSNGRL